MSQKHSKSTSRPAATASGAPLLPREAERVQELIDGRHSKAAVQLAKDLFKRCACPESESLLVLAYKARIDDLLKLGLAVEAKAMLAMVRERFPAAAARWEQQHQEICATEGKLETVVGALLDPDLPAANRESIETLIRQKTVDLAALAAVPSLPPEHPLRMAASALATAFQAVTQGPVDDALLALPEVSHRSPLAPWKALVRAIACYHRHEDAQCRQWLQAIAADSAPARLIPSLNAMMGQKNGAKCSPAETRLMAAAGDQDAVLRAALKALEEAFKAGKKARILNAIRTAMAASHHLKKEARERLRQHIAVRAAMQPIDPSATYAAVGGRPLWDAYFHRLFARGMEEQHNLESNLQAAVVWEEFRRQAIKEKWFAEGSVEDGVLSLHMAGLVERVPPELIEEMHGEMRGGRKASDDGFDALLLAGALYERGCKADPSFEAFQKWLQWAAKDGPLPAVDHVAEQWRKARPKDMQPLLYLMDAAEKRGAYKKSLKHLKEAEELDRLNPEVRRAKVRILLQATMRHLQQGKTHLAKAGVEQMETVAEVRPGEVAALATALHWCCAALDRDVGDRLRQEENLKNSIGDAAGFLLIASIARAGNFAATITLPSLEVSRIPAAELLAGAARVCALGQWAGLAVLLPRSWSDALIAAQTAAHKQPGAALDTAQLLPLGEAALDNGMTALAYAVSATGLASGRANARFLFLRVRCLPRFAFYQQEGCSLAALELARREHDTDLAGKILDRLRAGQGRLPMPPTLLSQILAEEKALKAFPIANRYQAPKYAQKVASLDEGDVFDDEDFDDDFDDEEEIFDDGFASSPPSFKDLKKSLAAILDKLPRDLAEQALRAIDAGGDPLTVLDKIITKNFSQPAGASSKGKAARAPSPMQGSLF